MKKVLFFTIIIVIAFTSCKKDKHESKEGITNRWTYIKYETIWEVNNEVRDSYLDYFDETDYLEIYDDGTYKDVVDGGIDSGRWELRNEGKTFVTDPGKSYEIEYEVRTLTGSSLVLYDVRISGINKYKNTTTLKK